MDPVPPIKQKTEAKRQHGENSESLIVEFGRNSTGGERVCVTEAKERSHLAGAGL